MLSVRFPAQKCAVTKEGGGRVFYVKRLHVPPRESKLTSAIETDSQLHKPQPATGFAL